ncbi:MAG: Na+/H+ antiporter NhaA [Chitinophagaceae bacterium]|nr:Na+/H+ antiporter NhaA [Chitinophagaceae bacterium]
MFKRTKEILLPSGVTQLFTEFFNSEKSSGVILIACTIISLIIANTGLGDGYEAMWHSQLGGLSLHYWINDALMAVFFLLVGLEIERELYIGELSEVKNAILPLVAAVGGMLVPAAIHFALNRGTDMSDGFGIPMATDIAFALGILSLAGKKVPIVLRVFLTALAIIDDLGAILVIAVFYTESVSVINLLISLGIFAALFVMGRMGVTKLIFYIIPGIAMWYFMFQSGVHATISGVLLAFAIPFGEGGKKSPSYRLQHFLHKPVAFGIIPLFALANTGIRLQPGFYNDLVSNKNSLGIIGGLVIGKPLGILLFAWLTIKTKLGRLPEKVTWAHLTGAGMLAGIGFTMSIFITLLAFKDSSAVINSKIAILTASLIAAISGLVILKSVGKATADGPADHTLS